MSNNLPILEDNWTISANNIAAIGGSTLESYRRHVFTIKKVLTELPMPWTVFASSNAVSYTGDGVPFLVGYPDQSGNNNFLLPTSMNTSSVTSDVPGGVFSTLSTTFATGDYIREIDNNSFNFEYTDSFSISFWFKTSSSGVHILVGKIDNSSPNAGWEIAIISGVIRFELVNNVSTNKMTIDETTGGYDDNAWHHIVCTWDGNLAGGVAGANIYVDGYVSATSTIADTLSSSILTSTFFQISGRDGSNFTFNGQIDDVAIWSKELSSDEVFDIWNNGVPNDISSYEGDDGYLDDYLEGYWYMGEEAVLTDASDYWKSYTHLSWNNGANNRSWIVLQHPVKNTQFLINCEAASATAGRITSFFVSFSGSFSGGSLVSRPTAPDQIEFTTGTLFWNWMGAITVAFNSWVSAWQSEDGLCNRLISSTDQSLFGRSFSIIFDHFDSITSDYDSQEIVIISGTETGASVGSLSILDANSVNKYNSTANFNRHLNSSTMILGPLKDANINSWSKGSAILNHRSSAENEYFNVGNVSEVDFDESDSFSLSVWFRSFKETGGSDSYIISKYNSSLSRGYGVNINSTNNEIRFFLASSFPSNAIEVSLEDDGYLDGEWHNIIITYDGSSSGSGVTFYLDGLESFSRVDTDTLSGTTLNTGSLQIGNILSSTTGCFVGNLTEVAIFNTEISQEDVYEVFNDGYLVDLRTTSLDGYLVGYWPINGDDNFPTITDLINSNNGTAINMENLDYPYGDSPNNPIIYYRPSCYGNSVLGEDFLTSMPATEVLNEFDTNGNYPAFKIGLHSDYGYNGFYGFLKDIWWGSDVFIDNPGDTFPDDSSNRQFVQYSNIILPWTQDNTIPLLGGSSPSNNTYDLVLVNPEFPNVGNDKTKFFQMTGIDTGAPTQPFYHSWVVTDSPDPSGALAVGPDAPPFGGPLTNIIISGQWSV
jgi:hypothetical protein